MACARLQPPETLCNLLQHPKLYDPKDIMGAGTPWGWSQLTTSLLDGMFIGEKVANGIDLKLRGGPVTIEVTFGLSAGDEEALNQTWFTKGASGLMPCALKCSCTNKPCHTDVASDIASLSDRDPTIPTLATSNVDQLGKRSDAEIWDMYDTLSRLPNKTQRDWWEHIYGLICY